MADSPSPDVLDLGVSLRPVQLSSFNPLGLALGQDTQSPLEVVLARHHTEPGKPTLRSVWKARQAGRATPVLLVVLYDGKAALCGPTGDDPPAYVGLDPGQVGRICRQALGQPNRHAALKALSDSLPAITSALSGIRNEGFLATHELEYGAPNRRDWNAAGEQARPLLSRRGEDLLKGLGFELEPNDSVTTILKVADRKIAVAVLLQQSESPELRGDRFPNLSPVSYALTVADRENLPYVVIQQGSKLRVYPVALGVGVGRRGPTETFVQCDTALLRDDDAAYLWLLCSADALCDGGSLESLLEASGRFSGELAKQLRERVYESVVPKLASGLVAARNFSNPTAQDLSETYEMAIAVLFRLLFIAYAEDKDLLPFKWNGLYQRRSLKTKAQEILELVGEAEGHIWGEGTDHWQEITRLFRAVDKGNPDWGVPPYNGGLFSDDPEVSKSGALLAGIELPDSVMGPVLRDLLIVEGPEGLGPVDFRSLGVREFGTIYEGLLESELSVAETDLTTDPAGIYRPCSEGDAPIVAAGEVYLHNASGARKATGTYFTKSFAVEHLLDSALEPALDDHFARLIKKDDDGAAAEFFDFRVADIAMGSGHFLVAAIDRIERRFTGYLAERHLPGVTRELAELRAAALNALGPLGDQVEIEDTQLLRRLIARRCIYGVDINPIAVQLSRLAIWIHTFVAGLPLSFLDHSLVVGNSLVGIGRMSEVEEAIRSESGGLGLWAPGAEDLLADAAEPLRRLANLADANPKDLQTAREAHLKARSALRPAEAFYDIVSATRISGGDLRDLLIDMGDWSDLKDRIDGSKYHRDACEALGRLGPLHFPIAFPEVFLRSRPGFDVILGNPPWEKTQVEEHEFWSRYVPGFKGMSQDQKEVLYPRLYEERPDLVALLDQEKQAAETMRVALLKGPYPGMGAGHPDLYKAFCWRFRDLVCDPGGRIGVVIPRAAFVAKGSQEFREVLFQNDAIPDLTLLLNSGGWVFDDADIRKTIALASFRKNVAPADRQVAMKGPHRNRDQYEAGLKIDPVRIMSKEVAEWTDSYALPLLPTEESLDVFLRLRRAPRFDRPDQRSRRARFVQGDLNATANKDLMNFSPNCASDFFPVYKGESFNIWEPDTGLRYASAHPAVVIPALQQKRLRASRYSRSAFSGRPSSWLADSGSLPCRAARIAFRDVTNRTNQRTVVVCLVPPDVILTHLSPYILFADGGPTDEAFTLGVMASIPFDWFARRFVDKHLTFFVANPLPIPSPEPDNSLMRGAIRIAGRLACPDDRFADWAERVGVECGPLPADEKEDMIHELDAVVSHLYGLEEKHLIHIFETFHEGWDYEDRLTATLKHFQAWATKL